MNALIELFQLIVIVLHKKLFGNMVISFDSTDRFIMLDYIVNGVNYEFMSTQYKLTIARKGLFKLTQIHYLYKVEVLNINEDHCQYYSHMCPKFLYKTSYPHRIAIDEHFKKVMKVK